MSHRTASARLALSMLLVMASVGCHTLHSSVSDGELHCDTNSSMQFERGRPNVVIDGVGWVFGIPSRVALWNWEVENHDISVETETQLQHYVAANNLQDVKVRLNQYDPGGEWRRLTENHRVSPGWRYTVGALSTVGYTLLPGRIFGGDSYNPFTNTLNVYSNVPSLGMLEAGYAKDVHHRTYPGTYAVSQFIPGLNLVHETLATRDVLDYVAERGEIDQQREALHVLYPRYGGAVGGAVEDFIPVGGVIEIGGLLAGHATGRIKSSSLPHTIAESAPAETSASSPIQTVGYEEVATDAP